MDVGFIPDQMLERKAYKLLSEFEARFGKIAEPPVPINKIIERHLDLWFDWDNIEDTEEEKILGFLDPATKKIHMNARRRDHFEAYVGSEAFTQAHEVAHWELHVAKAGEPQLEFEFAATVPRFVCRQDTKRSSKEIQADRYAAYLLMPHHLVMQEIDGLDLLYRPNLYRLKDKFGVTITALQIRLQNLALIFISADGRLFRTKEEYQGARRLV